MNSVPLHQLLITIYLLTNFIPTIFTQQSSRTLDNGGRGDKLGYLYNFVNRNGHQEMCKLLRASKLDNYLTSFEYTLISPTDDSFALLSPTIRQRLMNDTEYRLNFLKNHIINGRLFFSSISNGQQILINAVSNNRIHIAAYPNGYIINGAQLLAADRQIESTTNLAQFVDRPIYLQNTQNLMDYLSVNFKQLHRFIEISGLQDELQAEDRERTVFAPNHDAFRSLPWSVIEQMYNNNTFLRNVLKSHILNGIHYSLGLQGTRQSNINSLRTENGEKVLFRTKKLQGRNLVFMNDIPILNADQMVKNGLLHEISKLNLPKQLMEDCNCIEMDPSNNSINGNTNKTADLINRDLLIDNDIYSNNNIDQNQSILASRSTIIPESMKRRYANLHNRQYKPVDYSNSETTVRTNESGKMYRPIVFYDKSDLNYYTTISPRTPVSYHKNHNYYNPNNSKQQLGNNRSNAIRNNKSNRNNNDNFFFTDHNSLAFPANSHMTYSSLPIDSMMNKTSSVESPFLTIFDPFSPYANQTYPNSRSQFHSTTVNISQSSPSMHHYLTHVYHGDNTKPWINRDNNNPRFPFVYNMERLTIPSIPKIDISPAQPTTFKPIFNTNHPVVYGSNTPTTQIKPPTIGSTVAAQTLVEQYPIKSRASSNRIIAQSSKYYNDLTTPTPIHFDPTRKPKSPSYLNRIRRVNDMLINNNQYNANLQTSYQVMDSNVVQKIEDSKTSSNQNQQIIVPARLDLNRMNNLGRNRFNVQNIKNRPPLVTLSTINNNQSNAGTTRPTIGRNGRVMKNFNSPSPYITLYDVMKNPYLMINNQPVKFELFENLLNQTNLSDLLRNSRPGNQLTLILPANTAFQKLKDYELDYLKLKSTRQSNNDPNIYSSAMRSRKKRQLYIPKQEEIRMQIIKNLVLNHISPILVNPDLIMNQLDAKSYSNLNLQFTRKSNKLYVNNMPVLATTIVSNGVAYVVDNLIMANSTLFDVSNQQVNNNPILRMTNLNTAAADSARKKGMIMVSSVDSVFNPLSTFDSSKLNSSQNVIDIIENIPELSFFTGLVKKSNYSSLLATPSTVHTILAPENKAFSYLSHRMIDLLKQSPSFINRFVGNHIINANFSVSNLIVSPIVLNLNRVPIKIGLQNGMIVLNDTSIMKQSDIATANGFLHILTRCLIGSDPYATSSSSNVALLNRKPIQLVEPTIQDQLMEIAKSKSSAKFLTLFIQNNYINMLRNSRKNFTLILPSDIAYFSLPENVISKMENTTSKLRSLLNYHLLNQLIDPYDLQIMDQIASSTGLPLHYANVSALHELRPSSNSQEVNLIGTDPRSSIQSMTYSMINNETSSMENVDDSKRPVIDHLNNIRKLIEQLHTNSTNNQLTISGATVQDIRLIPMSNKYNDDQNYIEILFVDRVLYTPKGTIYDLIKSSPMLTILYELIEITNLRDEIDWMLDDHEKHRHRFDTKSTSKNNGYTFFAPSNSAFRDRLGMDVVEQLKKNVETANVFLLRHLIKRPLYTSSIPVNGSLVENSTGEHLNLERNGDIVAIEGVIVEIADVTTTNGVVHVIENVL